ncbi:MAG: N-acetyl sugar amidotransferase [Flammeovirgaceae bacterium]
MEQTEYQICNRCVMDTTDPDIVFDDQGNCNHCNDYFERTTNLIYKGEESDRELAAIVEKIKQVGKNREYDCVLGISGGVDSCYAAYVLKQLGLRVLAVHLDNGWDSDISVKNVKGILAKLGFDYQSYVLDWEEFKRLQIAFLKASVVDAEVPTDMAIPAALHRTAAEYGVKYIISGGNYATEGILPKSWGYYGKDMKFFNTIWQRFGQGKLKSYPKFGMKEEVYYKFVKGIRTVYVLNYVNFNKKDAMKLLQEELGWQYYGGKHYESKFTGFLQSYILYEKFNLDYRKATLSTQICAGEVTRAEALEELKTKPYDPVKIQQEKEYLCKKLELSLEQFDEIMNLPPKTYKDYPNNNDMIEFVYNTYRKLIAMKLIRKI